MGGLPWTIALLPINLFPFIPVLALKDKARSEGLETIWERTATQEPQCGFCELGLSCRICVMGPSRIDPFGEGPQRGICGADAHIMVPRNLGRMVAAGAASHSDHGRDLVETLLAMAEGRAPGYRLSDLGKLDRLAEEFGIAADLPPPGQGQGTGPCDDEGIWRSQGVSHLHPPPACRHSRTPPHPVKPS